MKVLVVLHGMPPQAGRTVVGTGLRAFANGEALRGRGHRVQYCTRAEDLPDDARQQAAERRKKKPLLLTTITGELHPPGDPRRMRRRLTAVGPAPTADAPDAPRPSMELGSDQRDTHPGMQAVDGPRDGLAPVGGPLGAPGNPFSFTEAHELHEIVQRVDPDVVLVEALEEARRLPEGRFSVLLDLFAPRILEQQFQAADDEREAVRVLDAIQRGDAFLFSNQRQKYFHLPLLALAGVDCTRDSGAVVPISCPPEFPPHATPDDPVFIAGGVFWPWADLSNGLASLLSILEARDEGQLHLYGGKYDIRSDTAKYADPRRSLPKDHARLAFRGLVPIDQLWEEYRRGSVAFDLMAPNPERELNLSFRQVDYLRCGLPIITSPRQIIADDLLDYGAGWVVEPGNTRALRRLVDELLDEPSRITEASAQAQALARDRYSWDVSADALDRLVRNPARRKREETFVSRLTRTQGDLWEEHEENLRLRELIGHQRADLDKKTDEIGQLNGRISTLMSSVDRLSDSLGAVSKFKNDSVQYLQEQHGEALKDVGQTALELERQALDLRKKQDALGKAQAEIGKLKQSITELRTDNEHLEARFVARDREALGLDEERKRAVDGAKGLRDRLDALRQDVGKKDAERTDLAAMHAEELADLRERLEAALGAGATSSAEADALRGELEELRVDLATARADGTKKTREGQRLQELATRHRAEHDRAIGTLRAEALERLELAEEAATRVAEELRDRLARSEGDRGRATARLAEARHRVSDLERELSGKERDLEGLQRRAEQEAVRWQSELARHGEQASEALRDAREAADERNAEVRRQAEEAKSQLALVEDRLTAARARLGDLETDVAKKTTALAESARERQRLEAAFLRNLDAAEVAAREVLDRARDRIVALEDERGALKARLDEVGQRARDGQREVSAKDQALERARSSHEQALARAEAAALEAEQVADRRLQDVRSAADEVTLAARAAADEARRGRDRALSELEKAKSRLADIEGDLAKKDSALARAAADRDRLQVDFLAALDRAEEGAEGLLGRARDGAARLERDRAALRADLDQAKSRLKDVEGDLSKKDAALDRAAAERDRLQQDFLAALDRAEEGAQGLLQRARDAASRLEGERATLRADLDQAKARVRDLERDFLSGQRALDQQKDAAAAERLRLEAEALQALDRQQRLAEDEKARLEEQHLKDIERQQAVAETERTRIEEQHLRVVEHQRATAEAAKSTAVAEGRRALEHAQRLADQTREAAAADAQQALEAAVAEQQRIEAEALRSFEQQRRALDAANTRHETALARLQEAADQRVEELKDRQATQLTEARATVDEAQRGRDALRARLERSEGRLADLEADLAKKDAALSEAATARDALEASFLASLERSERGATELIERARDAGARLERERGLLKAAADEAKGRIRDLERELEAAVSERDRQRSQWEAEQTRLETEGMRLAQSSSSQVADARASAEERIQAAQQAADQANRERDRVQGALEQVRARLADLEADVDKKDDALAELTAAQERIQKDHAAQQATESRRAQTLLEEARDRAAALDQERGGLLGRVERAEFEAREAQRGLRAKDHALEEAQRERDRLETTFLQALEAAEERAIATTEELRSRLNSLALDRATFQQQLRDTTARLRDTERTLALREQELTDLQRAASEAEAEFDAERRSVQEEAETRIQDAHKSMISARQQRDGSRDELLRVQSLADDLHADVAKKSSALEEAQRERSRLQEEFLGSLERAQGASKQVLEDAQDRVHRLGDQRQRLQSFIDELQNEAARLSRDLDTKDSALSTAQDVLQDERERYQMAMFELEELRASSQTEHSRVLEAEAELQRQQTALESLSGELARVTGQLEEAQFEATTLQSELDKKTREIGKAQTERDRAWTQAEQAGVDQAAQIETLRTEKTALSASLEQTRYELEGLRRDAEKKTVELEHALEQRDTANQEKVALQKALDDALETVRRQTEGEAPAKKPKSKKKAGKKEPRERRSRPRASDAPDTTAN